MGAAAKVGFRQGKIAGQGTREPATRIDPLDRVCRLTLYLLVLLVALLVWNGTRTAIEIKDLAVELGLCLVATLTLLRLLRGGEIRMPRTGMHLAAALLLAITLLAYLYSARHSVNTKAAMPQLCGLATFFFVTGHFGRRDVPRLVGCCLAAALAASAYALVQKAGLDPAGWHSPDVMSFFGNRNYFGNFLVLMIPLSGVAAASMRRPAAVAGLVAASLGMLCALAVTGSRGAMLGLLAAQAGALFLLAAIERRRLLSHPYRGWIFGALPVSAAVLLLVGPYSGIVRQSLDQAETAIVGERETSVPGAAENGPSGPRTPPAAAAADGAALDLEGHFTIRLPFYRAALEVISRHPWTGVGPGRFMNAYPANRQHKVYADDPNTVLNHVHNDWLEIWAEYGAVALLGYLGFWVLFLRATVKRLRAAGDPATSLTTVCFFTAGLGFLIHSQVTVASRYMSSAFYFWGVMAMAVLSMRGGDGEQTVFGWPRRYPAGRGPRLAAAAVVMLVGFGAARLAVNAYAADVLVQRAFGLSVAGRYAEALAPVDAAVARHPRSVEARYQRGYVRFQRGDIQGALDDYRWVDAVCANFLNTDFNIASCHYRLRDWPAAICRARRSVELYPEYLPAFVMLANCHAYVGMYEEAIRHCDIILEKWPGHAKADKLKADLLRLLRVKGEHAAGAK